MPGCGTEGSERAFCRIRFSVEIYGAFQFFLTSVTMFSALLLGGLSCLDGSEYLEMTALGN